jgi:hypothetical protein
MSSKRPTKSVPSPMSSVGVPVSKSGIESTVAKMGKDPYAKVKKAEENKYYIGIDLTGSSESRRTKRTDSRLKLSGAINRWAKNPNLIYQRTYRLVGTRDQVRYVLEKDFNLKKDEIASALANSYTVDNVETTMKEEYEKEVGDSNSEREGSITFNALTFISDAIAAGKYQYSDTNGHIVERADIKAIHLPSNISNSKRSRRTLMDKFMEVLTENTTGSDKSGHPIYSFNKILDISNSDTGKIVKAASQSSKYAYNARHPEIPIGSNSVERYRNALYEIYSEALADPSTADETRANIDELTSEMEEVIQEWINRNGFTLMSSGDRETDLSPRRRAIRPPSPSRSSELPVSRVSPTPFGRAPGITLPKFGKGKTSSPSSSSSSSRPRSRSRSRSRSPSPVASQLSPRSSRSPAAISPMKSTTPKSSKKSFTAPTKTTTFTPPGKSSTKFNLPSKSSSKKQEESSDEENPFDEE